MRRQLFLLHLRRSLTNVVIVFVAVLAVIFIVERITLARAGQGAAQVPEIVNMVLVGGLVLAAFPVGSAAFGKSFREQHALFLYSLPLRRIETWAILMAAAAAAYLLLLATAAVVRPSLIGTAFDGAATRDIGGAAALVAVLFAGGACLALAAPRQAVAFASGLLLLGPSIGLIALINADRFQPAAGDEAILVGPSVVAGVLLLAAIFLFLSALFYVRGEHELLSQVALRYAAVVGAVILAGVLFFAATALADRRAPMHAMFWDALLSPGGDYVAVFEAKRYLRYRQIRVFDARSGRELFRRRSPILAVDWIGNNQLLVVDSTVSVTRLMLSLPFETRATFLRPDGTVAATRELPSAIEASLSMTGRNHDANAETDPLLILESFDSGRSAFHVFTPTASSIELVGRGNGGVWATSIFDSGKRVLVNFDRGVTRVFRAGDTLEEIRWSARPPESRTGRHFYLLDGLVHPTEASAIEALSSAYPVDGALRDGARNAESGGYLFAKAGFSLLSLNPVRYLVGGTRASVWEWRKEGWSLLTDSIEMPQRRSSARNLILSLPETAAAAPDGTILYTKQEGGTAEVVAASAEEERTVARVDFAVDSIWVGWARRETPALVSIVLRNSRGSRTLIADLARNAVLASAAGRLSGQTLHVRADGTRIVAIAYFDDDDPDEPQREGSVIAARRYSYRLVEVRPDGTRHETRLGE